MSDDDFGAEIPLLPFYWAGDQRPGKRARRASTGHKGGVAHPWEHARERTEDDWLREGWTQRTLEPGETLWEQGEPADSMA